MLEVLDDGGVIGAGWLDADGVSGRSHDAKHGITDRVVVEPADELADDTGRKFGYELLNQWF